MIALYLTSHMLAQSFTKELLVLNIIFPSIAALMMLTIAFKFSGSPLRAAVYSQKLRSLQFATLLWSMSRIARAMGGFYESRLFYGMILGLKNEDYNTHFIPMLLIVVFLLIEILPFMYVLDWSFMEIFTMKAFPQATTEPLFEQ